MAGSGAGSASLAIFIKFVNGMIQSLLVMINAEDATRHDSSD
jgi:hypothetical protein